MFFEQMPEVRLMIEQLLFYGSSKSRPTVIIFFELDLPDHLGRKTERAFDEPRGVM